MVSLRFTLWTLTAAATFGLSLWPFTAAPVSPTTVVTVNGAALSETDVGLRMRPDHQREAATTERLPEVRAQVLETLIGEELAAQRAHELGLDTDAEYLAGLAPLQAQVDAYRRRALSERLAQHEVERRGAVTDAEARTFFEQNQARLKMQLQVWQILRRTPESIEQARQELAQAPSFEAYARGQFPQLASTERPWDLGFLRWEQLPESWRDVVYAMKKGEVSPVIHGEKDRYWILRLADARETPDFSFESVRPTLMAALKGKKLQGLRVQTDSELRAKARIVYAAPR